MKVELDNPCTIFIIVFISVTILSIIILTLCKPKFIMKKITYNVQKYDWNKIIMYSCMFGILMGILIYKIPLRKKIVKISTPVIKPIRMKFNNNY